MNCKNCGKENNNGTNFCTRKCRILWIKAHNIKGGRKRAEKIYEKALMFWGLSSSACDKSSVGGKV